MVERKKRKARAGDVARAVAYLRASTDDQELSVAAQRAAIEVWASRAGVEIASWHEDVGVSGATPADERDGLTSALVAIESHRVGLLVVSKRDRLARDTFEAGMIERLAERIGAKVVSADGAGNGDGLESMLLRGIMDLFAQFERAIIRSRTKAAMAVKKSKGESTGTPPYGFRRLPKRDPLDEDEAVRLESDAKEQAAVRVAKEMRKAGKSLRAIGSRLLDLGHRPREGSVWMPSTIASMVKAKEPL